MLLSSLLRDYATEQRTRTRSGLEGSLSETTLKNYLCRIRAFHDHLGERAVVADVTAPTMRKYCLYLCTEKSTAMRMHLAAIRHFCKWLKEEGWLSGDPCAHVPATKAKESHRASVPDEALRSLLLACDRLPRSPYRRKLSRAVMTVLIYSALRRAELLNLHVDDWNGEKRSLLVRQGKGGKSRIVYLPPEAAAPIEEYLALRPRTTQPFLFMLDTRWRLGTRGLQTLLADLHDVAGLKERYTPHQFRHACATRLYENDAPLLAISKFLGHSKIETTTRYIHADQEVQEIATLSALREKRAKSAPDPPPKTSPRLHRRGFR